MQRGRIGPWAESWSVRQLRPNVSIDQFFVVVDEFFVPDQNGSCCEQQDDHPCQAVHTGKVGIWVPEEQDQQSADLIQHGNKVIPVELNITQPDPLKSRWVFDYAYPGEDQQNDKQTVSLNKDGTQFNKERILKKTTMADKSVMIIT